MDNERALECKTAMGFGVSQGEINEYLCVHKVVRLYAKKSDTLTPFFYVSKFDSSKHFATYIKFERFWIHVLSVRSE